MIPSIRLSTEDFEWNPAPRDRHAYGLTSMGINGQRFHIEAFHVKPAEGKNWYTSDLVALSPFHQENIERLIEHTSGQGWRGPALIQIHGIARKKFLVVISPYLS